VGRRGSAPFRTRRLTRAPESNAFGETPCPDQLRPPKRRRRAPGRFMTTFEKKDGGDGLYIRSPHFRPESNSHTCARESRPPP
jgi:hypothetical protein